MVGFFSPIFVSSVWCSSGHHNFDLQQGLGLELGLGLGLEFGFGFGFGFASGH